MKLHERPKQKELVRQIRQRFCESKVATRRPRPCSFHPSGGMGKDEVFLWPVFEQREKLQAVMPKSKAIRRMPVFEQREHYEKQFKEYTIRSRDPQTAPWQEARLSEICGGCRFIRYFYKSRGRVSELFFTRITWPGAHDVSVLNNWFFPETHPYRFS